jgi:hypothetical protein
MSGLVIDCSCGEGHRETETATLSVELGGKARAWGKAGPLQPC